MPLKMFICPDGATRNIKDCLENCPLEMGRCLALSHLIFISNMGRTWLGQASVTQLIKPTRIAYLEITKNYRVNPDDMAFMMYGTLHHQRLETINKKLEGLSEQKIIGTDINGTLDRLEPDELFKDMFKLLDYKLVGAYSVAKALGIQNGKDVDPDMADWELQLNKYRILIESNKTLSPLFPVSRLFIQATIRDSGLKQMKSLGLPRRMPLIPVKKLEDDFVNEYFITKDFELHKALKTNTLPKMCNYQENWANRRCKNYCSVVEFCPEGAMINKIPLKKE